MFSAGKTVARVFVRGKRDAAVNPATQKVVNQLSALSASRKQPKLLNLCPEDLIKHKTITNAWRVYQRKQHQTAMAQLEKQYDSIKQAMDELKHVSPELYEAASVKESTRFPMELRVPTDYPANSPWVYNYKAK